MCSDWLCRLGNNGVCYFRHDPQRVGRLVGDLDEDNWDEMDRLHDEVIANPTSRTAASRLGLTILSHGERATDLNQNLGEQRFLEMKERYVETRPRVTRKMTLLRTDSAETAAGKIRELGEPFVSALRDALK